MPKPSAPSSKKPEPAYRSLAPIYDPKIASEVYQRTLDTPISLTYHELLSLSPEVRTQIREATSTKRTNKDQPTANSQNRNPQQANYVELDESSTLADDIYVSTDDEFEYTTPLTVSVNTTSIVDAEALVQQSTEPELQPGSIVVEDPIEQYFRSLRPGEEPDRDRLCVAKDSASLRCVIPLVDNKLKVEAIIDPGCQVIAMSEEICHSLSLAYDPSVYILMQSANGGIDQSLGLARNVPFELGGITLYMQVHIIRSPAYDILMGRPFDLLTQSRVQNFKNGDQTITIHDPNSNRVTTIPTVPRGGPKLCPHRFPRQDHSLSSNLQQIVNFRL